MFISFYNQKLQIIILQSFCFLFQAFDYSGIFLFINFFWSEIIPYCIDHYFFQ